MHFITRDALCIPTMHLVLPISTDKKFCPTREILCRGDRNEKHKDFPWRREVFWRDTRIVFLAQARRSFVIIYLHRVDRYLHWWEKYPLPAMIRIPFSTND